jgi:hypothetical protein
MNKLFLANAGMIVCILVVTAITCKLLLLDPGSSWLEIVFFACIGPLLGLSLAAAGKPFNLARVLFWMLFFSALVCLFVLFAEAGALI